MTLRRNRLNLSIRFSSFQYYLHDENQILIHDLVHPVHSRTPPPPPVLQPEPLTRKARALTTNNQAGGSLNYRRGLSLSTHREEEGMDFPVVMRGGIKELL